MNYVLVVDDSAVDRKVIGHVVEFQTGYGVKYAANGLEALEEIEALLPLAVVTDLNMPEMDGMQLVEEIRKRFSTVWSGTGSSRLSPTKRRNDSRSSSASLIASLIEDPPA